jgi:hypothetical protein
MVERSWDEAVFESTGGREGSRSRIGMRAKGEATGRSGWDASVYAGASVVVVVVVVAVVARERVRCQR